MVSSCCFSSYNLQIHVLVSVADDIQLMSKMAIFQLIKCYSTSIMHLASIWFQTTLNWRSVSFILIKTSKWTVSKSEQCNRKVIDYYILHCNLLLLLLLLFPKIFNILLLLLQQNRSITYYYYILHITITPCLMVTKTWKGASHDL